MIEKKTNEIKVIPINAIVKKKIFPKNFHKIATYYEVFVKFDKAFPFSKKKQGS
jgi:hypothetical protein